MPDKQAIASSKLLLLAGKRLVVRLRSSSARHRSADRSENFQRPIDKSKTSCRRFKPLSRPFKCYVASCRLQGNAGDLWQDRVMISLLLFLSFSWHKQTDRHIHTYIHTHIHRQAHLPSHSSNVHVLVSVRLKGHSNILSS